MHVRKTPGVEKKVVGLTSVIAIKKVETHSFKVKKMTVF